MTETHRPFLPAAGHDWALPLYDPFTRLLGAGRARKRLVEHAELVAGHRVLDLGCGTGTLVVELARAHPRVEVVGVDPDPKALALAQRKVDRAGVRVQLERGFADALPYPPRSFDRVVSSFVLHHLPDDVRTAAIREVARVLKPGGRLHLLDFAVHEHGHHFSLAGLFHRQERLRDNVDAKILTLFRDAGLVDARVEEHRAGLLMSVSYYRASAPRER